MSTVAGYAEALYNLALQQGVSADNPCVYQVRSGSDKYVVVSPVEPVALVLPLNVLWVTLEGTAVMRRRVSKVASTFQHTWETVTDYASIFSTEQQWAPEDAPVPIIVSQQGGQLTGPLLPRAATDYAATEAVPKSIVQTLVNVARNSLMSMYSNMNNRVLYDDQRIRALVLGQSTVSDRVTVLENTVGAKSLCFLVDLDSDTWVIEHNLGASYAVAITTFDAAGDPVWPDSITALDEHASIVRFLLPLSGVAILTGVKKPVQ